MINKNIKKIVIKIGSSLVADYKNGSLKKNWINSLVNDLLFLVKKKLKL